VTIIKGWWKFLIFAPWKKGSKYGSSKRIRRVKRPVYTEDGGGWKRGASKGKKKGKGREIKCPDEGNEQRWEIKN